MAKDERSFETTHSSRPGTTTLDYIALGLLLAPPAVVFDVYVRGGLIDWWKAGLATVVCWVSGGLTVTASKGWQSWRLNWRIIPFLIIAENRWWGKASIIAVCMVGVLILSSFLSSKPPDNNGDTALRSQLETQKTTLIEWLQQAQRERDQAIRERNMLTASKSTQPSALNATIEATKRLPSADRERLADELYDVSQLLDKTVKLSEAAAKEVLQIGTDAVGLEGMPPLSKEKIEIHRQKLMSFSDLASAYRKDFEGINDKLKYDEAQILYIMGNNPTNKISSLKETIDAYIDYFNAWSKIKNIDELRGMILVQQFPFGRAMEEFRMWKEECDRRLTEIRNAIQRT